jgi:hypothetical protein
LLALWSIAGTNEEQAFSHRAQFLKEPWKSQFSRWKFPENGTRNIFQNCR